MGMSFIGLFFATILFGGGGAPPLGLPPQQPDPRMNALPPETCIYFVQTHGRTTQPLDPRSEHPTERLLADPEIQHTITSVKALVWDMLEKELVYSPNERANLRAVRTLVEAFLVQPAAFYFGDISMQMGGNGPTVTAAIVLKPGQHEKDVLAAMSTFEALAINEMGMGQVTDVTVAGRQLRLMPTPMPNLPIHWGKVGDYLILTLGPGTADHVVAKLTDANPNPPQWILKAKRQTAVDRPASFMRLDWPTLRTRILGLTMPMGPQVQTAFNALGLMEVGPIASTTGMSQTALVSRTYMETTGELRGLFSPLEAQPLNPNMLRRLPADATIAMGVRFNGAQAYQTFRSMLANIEPRAQNEFDNEISRIQQTINLHLHDDLLANLGDVWSVHNAPSEGGLAITGAMLSVDITNLPAFTAAHSRFIERLKLLTADEQNQAQTDQYHYRSRPLWAYRVSERDGIVTHCLAGTEQEIFIMPAWSIIGDRLFIAGYPQIIRAHLLRDAAAPTLAQTAPVAQLFRDRQPLMFGYVDCQTLGAKLYPLLMPAFASITAELRDDDIEIDASILPPASSVLPNLTPQTWALYRTDDGVELVSEGPLPISGVNLGGAMINFMVFANARIDHAAEGQVHEAHAPATATTTARPSMPAPQPARPYNP